jgi:Bacteriophage HK97-gp10, putative tail-component
MAGTINVRLLQNRFKAYGKDARKAYRDALDDCLDDLVRTASQSAPHDEGILEKSWSKEVVMDGSSPVGVISFSVKKQGGNDKKKGNFNYALKMHEERYNLGEKSQAKTGGTGMSGKTYPVGTGYLGDVLKGEAETYERHIENAIRNFSNRY